MKNTNLIKTSRNGRYTYRMFSSDTIMDEFFDEWAFELSAQYAFNTVKSYCYPVCTFLNYIVEIEIVNKGLTPELLIDAYNSYESFLVHNKNSDNELARIISISLNQTKNLSGATIELAFAAINCFLAANEVYRERLNDLNRGGYINNESISEHKIINIEHKLTNHYIRNRMREKSWLSGCIMGGPKKIKRKGLCIKSKASSIIFSDEFGGDKYTFPFDKAVDFIKSANNLRDKLLYSFLFSAGTRPSEALSILISDIDLKNRKVYIINPEERINILSNYLSEKIINALPFKGRDTSETFMISPFSNLFWNYLDEYMHTTYKRNVKHPFLFQKLNNGEPFVNSYDTALKTFKKLSKKITSKEYGLHSPRHMYGYYLSNWCPTLTGWGLPLSEVQKYMGHVDINSTKRYARQDIMKLSATITYANALADRNNTYNTTQQKINVLKEQILKLENLLIK